MVMTLNRRRLISGAAAMSAMSALATQALALPGLSPPVGFTGKTATTWNPADTSGNISLSNANRTATNTTAATQPNRNNARANKGRSAGKFYFEGIWTGSTIKGDSIGVSVASHSLSAGLGSETTPIDSIGFTASGTGDVVYGAVDHNSYTNYASGNTIGCAVDLDAGSIWFAVSNSWIAGSPAAGTGGFAIIAGGLYFPTINLGIQANSTWTLNATAAQQSYSPPSGFSAWG